MPGLVEQVVELVLELRDERIRVARADRAGDRLLGEVHRVVGGAADPDPDDPGRAGLAARVDDRLEHELLDALHAVGGHAASSGSVMFSEPEPLGTHLTSRPSQSGMKSQWTIGTPVADVRARVLARQRVDGVRAQRDARPSRAPCPPSGSRRSVPGGAGSARRRGSSRRRSRCPGRRGSSARPRSRRCGGSSRARGSRSRTSRASAQRPQRVAQILRDVLQRPDVEVRSSFQDCVLQAARRSSGVSRSGPSLELIRACTVRGSRIL